ncbi:hypothetical protein [Microbispora triticiradicis]|uniref:hypothetical protein n=1 Tax=Microbispora triticiradicis TaxID=2200763 RepID=UPI001AD76C1B|nr:hypothetical protein [Microbispora triticiradicis]MBO4272742.1 hypothetical protein [Microbispora triticiradicis]
MRFDKGLYVLAAVIVPDGRASGHRAVLRGLLLSKQPRLHWRDEGQKRRLEIACAIASLSLTTDVVIGTGLLGQKQRRARRKCLEGLLWHLAPHGVRRVVMERRNAEGDKEDLDLVNALRAQRALPHDMHVEWGDPLIEELLWLPDVVAGVVARAEAGDDTFWNLLRGEHVIERVACE